MLGEQTRDQASSVVLRQLRIPPTERTRSPPERQEVLARRRVDEADGFPHVVACVRRLVAKRSSNQLRRRLPLAKHVRSVPTPRGADEAHAARTTSIPTHGETFHLISM